ncbi:hypothetical protein HDU81_000524 [Chytriomyces hyalinus]|nr:hypothetical protein HDU81_000524 [Chytriomyces hyalinus]
MYPSKRDLKDMHPTSKCIFTKSQSLFSFITSILNCCTAYEHFVAAINDKADRESIKKIALTPTSHRDSPPAYTACPQRHNSAQQGRPFNHPTPPKTTTLPVRNPSHSSYQQDPQTTAVLKILDETIPEWFVTLENTPSSSRRTSLATPAASTDELLEMMNAVIDEAEQLRDSQIEFYAGNAGTLSEICVPRKGALHFDNRSSLLDAVLRAAERV